jgi:DNA-binding MarR family transcriptional regulator
VILNNRERRMREPLERLFLREKPVSAIMAVGEIENAYAALVARRIDSTVPHTCGILSELEEKGLIISRPEGRINYLELTDRGQDVAQALRHILELLQGPDALRQRLERLRQMATGTEGSNAALCLGPLRRDLARLMILGDKALCRDAEELDAIIASLVRK